jgi:LCP family protein required for cell wall assembly/PAS domain S-box-containing protein
MPDDKAIEVRLTDLFSEVDVSTVPPEDRRTSVQNLMEDVSARKEARRQEALFQTLVENAIDAVFVSDPQGFQIYCNRACYTLFGYDYACREMGGLPLASLWLETDAHTLTEQIFPRAKVAGWSGEVRLKRKDGTLFDACLVLSPVLDKTEQLVNIAAIIRDISERRTLERERDEMLEHRACQAKLITEISQEIATATSLDELYRRVVSVIKERLGHWHVRIFRHDPELEALIFAEACGQAGESGEDVAHRVDEARGTVVTAAAFGQAILVPDVSLNPPGMPRPDLPGVKSELAVPIKLKDQVLGVLDVLSDTAGALTREDEIVLVDLAGQIANAIRSAQLIEETHILRQFADAPEGIGWITLEGSLFIYVNPKLSSILGEDKPEDTFGKPILLYYPDELRQRVQNKVLPTAIREGQWVGELAFLSAWGKVVPTIQSIFLVRDDAGKPLYLANVVTDISEQKRAESVADRRIRQIGCLNDVGRKIETRPQVPELLQWVASRIPQVMQHPQECVAAIEFEDADHDTRTVYGEAEAISLPHQIVENLHICGDVVGRVCVSYTQEREFFDEDRALVGDIARRVSNYAESRHLSKQARVEMEKVRSVHQIYMPEQWTKRTPKPAPPEEVAQPEMTAPRSVGVKALLEKSRVYEALQDLLRRTPLLLFILVLMMAVLAGALLSTRIRSQVQSGTPASTPTAVAVTRARSNSAAPPPLSTEPVFPTSVPHPPMATPFNTPSPSLSPTSLPTFTPTPRAIKLVVPQPFSAAEPATTSTLPIPSPVQPVPVASDAVNIVVLGSDQRPDWTEWHTDAVHVVSIQRERGVVSVISIPRDLYVYIPGFWMSRINFADYYGEAYDYEGGGPALVRDTLLYNLGIRADYYVRTNFDGLIGIVDTMEGVDIPVHCGLSDYWPYPDENGEYPTLTLEPAVHHMDGETALWYARTRMTTSVFARERRQQQVLQALWHKLRDEMTLVHIPSLWEQRHDVMTTDLTLADVLDLARIAFALEDQDVRFYNIDADVVTPWTTPYGGHVFLPRWEAIQPIVTEAMAPMPEGRLKYAYSPVEVWNGTPNQDWDLLAADRLRRAGFSATISKPDRRDYAKTQLFLFRENAKGSGIGYLQQTFNIPDSQVTHRPGGSSEVGLRLILGADYQTCPYP